MQQLGKNMEITSDNGDEKLAIEVFADALKFFKQHAEKKVKTSQGR